LQLKTRSDHLLSGVAVEEDEEEVSKEIQDWVVCPQLQKFQPEGQSQEVIHKLGQQFIQKCLCPNLLWNSDLQSPDYLQAP
jgi:hypothetical protein